MFLEKMMREITREIIRGGGGGGMVWWWREKSGRGTGEDVICVCVNKKIEFLFCEMSLVD